MDHQNVEQLARLGATEEDIALDLGLSLEQLQECYRRELDRGRVQGRHAILQRLFSNAASDSNSTATSMWVKAQCGWRDTGVSPNFPTPFEPVLNVFTVQDDEATDPV